MADLLRVRARRAALLQAELGHLLLARQLLDRPSGQGLDELLEARDQCLDRRLGRPLDRIRKHCRRCRATDAEMTRRMDGIDRHLGQHFGDASVRLVSSHAIANLALEGFVWS
jgi:hypothetical protein